MVKGPLPGHEMTQPQPSSRPAPAPKTGIPFTSAIMGVLSTLCVLGAAILAVQFWPNATMMAYGISMLAGAALFAAIAAGLHLLHRIANAVERRS